MGYKTLLDWLYERRQNLQKQIDEAVAKKNAVSSNNPTPADIKQYERMAGTEDGLRQGIVQINGAISDLLSYIEQNPRRD